MFAEPNSTDWALRQALSPFSIPIRVHVLISCHLLLLASYSSSLRPSCLVLMVKILTQPMSLSPQSLLGSPGCLTNMSVVAPPMHLPWTSLPWLYILHTPALSLRTGPSIIHYVQPPAYVAQHLAPYKMWMGEIPAHSSCKEALNKVRAVAAIAWTWLPLWSLRQRVHTQTCAEVNAGALLGCPGEGGS